MKFKNLIITGILFVTALCSFGQQAQGGGDRIEALRVAYITQKLNLTPEEAQKFWPVYNTYKGDLENIRKALPKENPTANEQLEFEQKKLDLKKKYRPQFEAALGTEKLNQLYNLEREFQEKLKEIREQRMQQRGAKDGQGRRPGMR